MQSSEQRELARQALQSGLVIPASPLALTAARRLDERRQRALCRYYAAAGAGGLAVGVHTTQFAIRDPKVGLFEPVLSLAAEEMDRADANRAIPLFRVAGICGDTPQATAEANLARERGYHAGLLNLGAFQNATEDALIAHCQAISEILPLFGFYLQPAAGGRLLPYRFWRRFVEIENVVAIKIAPFNRYQTLDVVRAVAEAGREDIALYTGNDDNILLDLLTPYLFPGLGSQSKEQQNGEKSPAVQGNAFRKFYFDELVARYEKEIFAIIYREINDFGVATDLTMETFYLARDEYDTIPHDTEIFTWLHHIAISHCKKFILLWQNPPLHAPNRESRAR